MLKGVGDIWGLADVYRTFKEGGSRPAGCTPPVGGQPLKGRTPGDAPDPDLIALPIAWVKMWTSHTGKMSRVFPTTMGSAEDYQNAGLRRLTVNAAYWCLGLEDKIDPRSNVDAVGASNRQGGGFDYVKHKVVPRKPSFYK